MEGVMDGRTRRGDKSRQHTSNTEDYTPSSISALDARYQPENTKRRIRTRQEGGREEAEVTSESTAQACSAYTRQSDAHSITEALMFQPALLTYRVEALHDTTNSMLTNQIPRKAPFP